MFWKSGWSKRKVRKYLNNFHYIFDWPRCWMRMQSQSQNIPVVVVTYLIYIIELSFTTSDIIVATQFTTYTKGLQMRRFFWAEGIRIVEIPWRLSAQWRWCFPQLNSCCGWRTIHNDYRTECCTTPWTTGGRLWMKWQTNRRLVMVLPLKSSPTDFCKLHARWILNQQRQNHLDTCTFLLNWCNGEGYAFLSHIVMGEEIWIHH